MYRPGEKPARRATSCLLKPSSIRLLSIASAFRLNDMSIRYRCLIDMSTPFFSFFCCLLADAGYAFKHNAKKSLLRNGTLQMS